MKYELSDIVELMKKSKFYGPDKVGEWFFPSDLIPHSRALKDSCKKLHARGLLDRCGSSGGGYGYSYRIKL